MEDEFNMYGLNMDDESNKKFAEYLEKQLIPGLIESNWQKILTNGIDHESLHNLSRKELDSLQETLRVMLDYYQNIEEYERCQVLHNHTLRIKLIQELNI